MQKPHDNSKASPAAFMQDNTLIAVIEPQFVKLAGRRADTWC